MKRVRGIIGQNRVELTESGEDLRTEMAASFLAALLSNSATYQRHTQKEIIDTAVTYAEALIERLKK